MQKVLFYEAATTLGYQLDIEVEQIKKQLGAKLGLKYE